MYFSAMAKELLAVASTLAMGVSVAADAPNPGNTKNDDFQTAKKELLRKVYFDHATTLYCGYPFDRKTKEVTLPNGFYTPAHKERATRVEWEHVVPAEHFGQSFKEWREGSNHCLDNKGHRYKGRRCANDANQTYRYIQADMYNLFPAVGAVNALRSNYQYRILDFVPNTFGTCEMKVQGKYAEPPERSRGRIARAMLYMADTYPAHYRLSDRMQKLVDAWNEQYPVDAWECVRAARIEAYQGNQNPFVVKACKKLGLPYTTKWTQNNR